MALPPFNIIYFYYLYMPPNPWLFATKKIRCEVKSKIHLLRFPQATHIKVVLTISIGNIVVTVQQCAFLCFAKGPDGPYVN